MTWFALSELVHLSEFVRFVTGSENEKLIILWAEPKRFSILKFWSDKSDCLLCSAFAGVCP